MAHLWTVPIYRDVFDLDRLSRSYGSINNGLRVYCLARLPPGLSCPFAVQKFREMVASTLFLLSLFTLALGNPLSRRIMQVHESRGEVPEGFVQQGAAPPDTVLKMRIALTQNNIDGLHEALMDVSTPSSPLYGQHLSKSKVSATEIISYFPEILI